MRSWDQRLHDEGLVREGPHAGIGMHRLCELDLLSAVVNGKMAGFVVIGCGQKGAEFMGVGMQVECLGIDRFPQANFTNAEYWDRELIVDGIFSHDVYQDLLLWRSKICGPVLFYTDNGNKVAEIYAMMGLCLEGDILGTHDLGTEVPLDIDNVLSQNGFKYLAEFDKYIDHYLCHQGFWIKQGDKK